MNTVLNRNRLVQPVARILRQLLTGFALATAVRAARRGPWLQPCRTGPPARRETSAQSRSTRAAASKPAAPKTSPVLGAAARGGLAPSLGLHNKERAGELNPLTSADSPRSSIAICQVLSKGSRGNPAPWWRQGLWTMPKVAAPFPRLRVHCPSTSTIHLSCSLVSRLSTSG